MHHSTLPVREPIFEGESLTSVIRRHAAAMGYESVGRILAQADGIRFPKQLERLGRGPPLEWLARFLRRDPESIAATTVHAWHATLEPPPAAGTVAGSLNTPTIDRYFDFTHRRVCPACLREPVPFERLVWSFRPLVVCPEHGVMLVDRCPACGRSLSALRMDLRRCRCGSDLSLATTVMAGECASALSRELICWLAGARLPSIGLPRPVLFLWLTKVHGAALRTPVFLKQSCLELGLPESPADESLAWSAAARLIQRWPTELESFLDELQAVGRPAARSTRAGLAFRDLQRAAERLERLGYSPPGDALRHYLLERYTHGHVTSKGILFRDAVHRGLPADRPWITQTEAARRLCLRPPSVAALVGRGVLEGRIEPSGPRGRTNGVVRRESVDRYAKRLEAAWSVKRAADRLGVDRPRILELIRCDLLRDAVRGPNGWLIPADVVVELLQQLGRLPSVKNGAGDMLPLREALRRLGVCGWNLAKLLAAVVDGSVAAYRSARGAPRISDLSFARSDLACLRNRTSIAHADVVGYSLSSVAAELVPGRRVGPRCLRKWIAAGLLTAKRRRKSWWIDAVEAVRFHATYCVAREVCGRLGIARSTLDRWEVERRLTPVYGRRTCPGAGTSVFLRADVERLAAERAA